ncbi:MAG: hypothetical protein AB1397_02505 [bacterium]
MGIRPLTKTSFGNLSGKISSGTTGISGVRVKLLKDGIPIRTDMSGNDGSFMMENIPIGMYMELS